MRILQIIDHNAEPSAPLCGNIAAERAGSHGNTVTISKCNLFVQKEIQDTGCINTLHAPAFQNQTSLIHVITSFYIMYSVKKHDSNLLLSVP